MFLSKYFGQVELKPDHYYIYLKSQKKEIRHPDFNMEIGQYASTNLKLYKATNFQSIEELVTQINKKSCTGVIFYIHGFHADTKQFEENTSKYLHDEVFSKIDSQYNLIVSLKWTSFMEYEPTIPLACQKGKYFAPMVDTIIQSLQTKSPNLNIAFINHSMGNRIFENIMIAKEENKYDWKINTALMFAPDLESNVFFTTLKHVPIFIKNTYIFHNIDDRTLAMAHFLKKYNRLGIYGHDKKEDLPKNVHQINTTGLQDNEGTAAKLTLHRYFYTSKTMREKMVSLLINDKGLN